MVNSWTEEAECLCDPGYSTEGGLPCQSTCEVQPDYCLNGGLCEIIPGHGATCRYPKSTEHKVKRMIPLTDHKQSVYLFQSPMVSRRFLSQNNNTFFIVTLSSFRLSSPTL